MSKFDIIIHAGMHKTGSSSIQLSFRKYDPPELTYLPWGPQSNHNSVYAIAFSDTPEKTLGRIADVKTLEEAVSRQEFWRDEMQTALEALPEGKILISAEGIANSTVENVQAFHSMLAPFAKSFRIIIYVREPIGYATSAFQQALKQGTKLHFPGIYKYEHKLQKFYDIFGKDAVEIYPFEREFLKGGDVVLDIADKLGISFPEGKSLTTNESISLEMCALLYALWEDAPADLSPQKISVVSRAFAREFGGLGQRKCRLSSQVTSQIATRLKRDLLWLEENAGIAFDLTKADKEDDFSIDSPEALIPIAIAQEAPLQALLQQKIKELAPIEKRGFYDQALVDATQEETPLAKVVAMTRLARELVVEELQHNAGWNTKF